MKPVEKDEFILFPQKCHRFFGFALQRVAFVTLCCVFVGVCEDTRERGRGVGKRHARMGASGVLSRIEI